MALAEPRWPALSSLTGRSEPAALGPLLPAPAPRSWGEGRVGTISARQLSGQSRPDTLKLSLSPKTARWLSLMVGVEAAACSLEPCDGGSPAHRSRPASA